MDDTSTSARGGIGFFGLLAIVFITLKLTHYITWSWTWVLAPLWMPIAIFGTVALVAIIIALIVQDRGGNPFR